VDNYLEKIHCADTVKDAISTAGFSASTNFELDEMTSHKNGLVTKHSFKMATSKVELSASFKTNFSRIAGTLEAETAISGKTQCLLVIGGNKKVTFLE